MEPTEPEVMAAATSAKSTEMSAAEAKREARRRRILENSSNRLAKISGREINSDETTEKIIYPDPEIERDTYDAPPSSADGALPQIHPNSDPFAVYMRLLAMQNKNFDTSTLGQSGGDSLPSFGNLSTMPFGNVSGGRPAGISSASPQFETNSIFEQLLSGAGGGLGGGNGAATSPPPPPPSKLSVFLQSRLHIIVLAIATYLLVASGLSPTANVFLLFLVCELTEVITMRSDATNSTISTIIMMFLGSRAILALKWLKQINKILCDVAYFVFFFVGMHLLWEHWWLGVEWSVITDVLQLQHI